MPRARGRALLGGLAVAILALFAGRWVALLLSERWWAAAVDPAAVALLTRWHLLGLLLEVGGVALAAAWCVTQLLLVVGSISAVQVPRRIGDLEIRELLPPERLRTGAILAGCLLGLLVGTGSNEVLPQLMQGWQGVRYGVADPILGADLGVYLVQLPLWGAALDFARRLAWVALAGAACCHFLVGGVRVSRHGVAMTDAARIQLGLLVALTLALAAVGEALGPLRAVAGLEGGSLATLTPVTRWSVAALWGISAAAVALWTIRPWSGLVLIGLGLWVTSGLLSRIVAPGIPARALASAEATRSVAAVATGLERLRDEPAPAELEPGSPPGSGLWSREALALLLRTNEAKLLALAPAMTSHAGGKVPTWLAVRRTAEGPELVTIAEDRLSTGGAPVSFRDQDPGDYPGVVSWRRLDPLSLHPERSDTVAHDGEGGIPLGGSLQRLLLAWGTQTAGILGRNGEGASLFWRMSPQERAARLLPMAWWGEARPVIVGGTLEWAVDGWLVGPGAPLAPPIPWEGATVRYARPAFTALIEAATGRTTLFLRPDADALARGWADVSAGAILPADSLPVEVTALPMTDLELAVKGWAVEHGSYGLLPEADPSVTDSLLLRPSTVWDQSGASPELALNAPKLVGRTPTRLAGLLIGAPEGVVRFIRWPGGQAPHRARALDAEWQRFASYERLQDSILAVDGKILPSPVRYEVGARGTLAVQVLYAVTATGMPTVAWVDLARAGRLGAARTPATAWANLRGESAPLVPAPDLPDALTEARRWAARADTLLRAGDLEGFGRAFGALKRVLGTP